MELCFLFFLSILIGVFNENTATVLTARCRSRCLAKEIQRYKNITLTPECITQDCSACMKPCQEKKKGMLSCSMLCGSFVQVKSKYVCRDSCKFLKHLHLEDYSNSSCPTGVMKSKCVLMSPENVQVSAPTKKESGLFTISWNGTWLHATVFVVMTRTHKKGISAALQEDASQGWKELRQTTLQSVKVELQPLVWHQFKVLAANQYTTSSFSLPSQMEFVNPRSPGPPREFRVLSMRTVKGYAEVDISWRKPDNNIGLPIHRYKLSWSMRPDIHLDQYESFQVTDIRIKGNIHQYTITELKVNTTYKLELRAIVRWNEKRVKSSRVSLSIRTPALAGDNIEEKPVLKKKIKITNSITTSKKNRDGKIALVSKPTMQGPNSTSIVSTHSLQASTPQSNQTSNLKAQESVATCNLINVLGLHIILIALAVTMMY